MNKTANNERVKLLASWLNSVSVAILGAGGLLPLLSVYVGVGAPMREPELAWPAFAFCVVAAIALHWAGSLLLRRLSDG